MLVPTFLKNKIIFGELKFSFSIPTRINVVVVFPAPLCPNKVHTSPSKKSSERSETA